MITMLCWQHFNVVSMLPRSTSFRQHSDVVWTTYGRCFDRSSMLPSTSYQHRRDVSFMCCFNTTPSIVLSLLQYIIHESENMRNSAKLDIRRPPKVHIAPARDLTWFKLHGEVTPRAIGPRSSANSCQPWTSTHDDRRMSSTLAAVTVLIGC